MDRDGTLNTLKYLRRLQLRLEADHDLLIDHRSDTYREHQMLELNPGNGEERKIKEDAVKEALGFYHKADRLYLDMLMSLYSTMGDLIHTIEHNDDIDDFAKRYGL